jgi:lipopolysaccharide biosynthesis glycosyltransferase
MTSFGVIYVATGSGYVDLAVQSAKSLRATNPGVQVDLFTNDLAAPELELFDKVHLVPHVHARAKLDCLPLSRFDQTLFLDADTLVINPLGDLWDIANVFDLAMAHDVRRTSNGTRQGFAVKTPYAFPQLNSGVILYRNTAATHEFFREWAGLYHASNAARDQIILKDLLWNTGLRVHVLPEEFNLRRITLLDAWEPLDVKPTILHSHRLLQHLLDQRAERVTTAARILELERMALAKEWALIQNTDPITRFNDVVEGVNAPASDRGKAAL